MNDTSLLNPDGTHFKPSDTVQKFIVSNETIDMFLNSDQDSSKVILVGQKGSGKSILIHYKNFKDRKETSEKDLNKFFIPEEGIEIIQLGDQISSNDISKNVKYTDWEKIYTVTFYYFILAKLKNQLIKYEILSENKFDSLEFHKIFNPMGLDCTALSFGSILEKALKNRSFLYKNQGDFIAIAKQIIKLYLREKEVAVYFDNLDQTLFNALQIDRGNLLENEEDNKYGDEALLNLDEFIISSPYQFPDNVVTSWLHSHVGYYIALYKINELDRKLKIFSTFRLEAYEYLNHLEIRNKPQYRGIACKMEYSDHDFENIYLKLLEVAKIEKKQLEKLKLDILPHDWVKNSLYKSETLWSYIKRHTFGNPREITYQIQTLKKLLPKINANNQNTSKRILEFKTVMAEEALRNIFKDFKSESLPVFPSEELLSFYTTHKKNWIRQDQINDNVQSLIVMLYRLGLVGIIKRNGKKFKQLFLEKNVYYSNHSISLPESPYYIFHPTLDHILLNKFPHENFYYTQCIVGNKKEFHFLREPEYYMPKELNKAGSSHFESFFNLPDQFEKYSAIQNEVINKWFSIIWDYIFKVKNENWLTHFENYVNNDDKHFHGLRKANNDNNVRGLFRNYKMRLVIAFASLTGLVKSHTQFKEAFIKRKFNHITYFSNIRSGGDRFERYLNQLSDFERDIIETALEDPKFSDDLTKKMEHNFDMKGRVEKKIEDTKERLQNYK